jgi:hypothetical protein
MIPFFINKINISSQFHNTAEQNVSLQSYSMQPSVKLFFLHFIK